MNMKTEEMMNVTFEEYEEKRNKTMEFFKEVDAKIKELQEDVDIAFARLQKQKESSDKLFIDYILASNSITKLQDIKISMLKILKEMENNIEFID